jgi:uncharacterized protein with GYD domain
MFNKEMRPVSEEEAMEMRKKIEEKKKRKEEIKKEVGRYVLDVTKVIVGIVIYDTVMDIIDKQ